MSKRIKGPPLVSPISSKKQLLDVDAVRIFLGGISPDSLERIRGETAEGFPKPLQMFGKKPLWSVEQIERYVTKKEKQVESLSA